MTADRWRTLAVALLVWHTMRSMPWVMDTFGSTWGVVFNVINPLAALVLLAVPIKSGPPRGDQ